MSLQIKDIYDFVLKNRRGRAFLSYSEKQIRYVLAKAFEDGSIIVDTDETGKHIFGIGLGVPSSDYKLMHVSQILTIRPKYGMRRIMDHFVKLFPDWEIQAERKGNLIRYKNFKNLVKKVSIYG